MLLVIVADFKSAYHRVTMEAVQQLPQAQQDRLKMYVRRVGLACYELPLADGRPRCNEGGRL